MNGPSFCWHCHRNLKETFATIEVDGKPVRVHKVCAKNAGAKPWTQTKPRFWGPAKPKIED